MGFKKPTNNIKLVFDGDLEGLEVTVKSPTVKTALFLDSLQRSNNENSVPEIAKSLAEHIVNWNMEDDNGKAIKVTYNELLGLSLETFQALMTKWIESTSGVSAPLESSSVTTSKQLEELIPMDV